MPAGFEEYDWKNGWPLVDGKADRDFRQRSYGEIVGSYSSQLSCWLSSGVPTRHQPRVTRLKRQVALCAQTTAIKL